MDRLNGSRVHVRAAAGHLDVMRSLLFVPGDDARKQQRATSSGADALIFDLEDSVTPDRKVAARASVIELLGSPAGEALRIVRCNGLDTMWGLDDVLALVQQPVDAIMLPKASIAALERLPSHDATIVALIETSRGLREAFEVAMHPNVIGLALGGADLGAELAWVPDGSGEELLHPRSVVVVDSAAAGIRGPIDVVHLAARDRQAVRAETEQARRLGLTGKMCIHPDQVDVVNAVFTPGPAERAEASRIVAALDEATAVGRGVALLDGRLIDAPVARRARTTIKASELFAITTPSSR